MKRIITIGREFGSGGRELGRRIAKKLEIAYYDQEIITEIAKRTALSEEYIRQIEEMRPILHFPIRTGHRFYLTSEPIFYPDLSIYTKQHELLRELSRKSDCVIVGRCADYILKDRSDVLNVFIYADKAYRAERIVRLYGQSDKKPEDRLEDKDKRRSVNYKHYTGQNWGEMRNYDLCLNSAVFSEDTCTQLIAELAEKR